MAADLVLTRLSRANPIIDPAPVEGARALRRSIVSSPGDPRLLTPRTARPRGRRKTVVFLAAAATLTAGVGLAATVLTPDRIFADNPAQDGGVGPGQERHAIPGTARQVTTSEVPGVGTVEIWTSDGSQGSVCLAARGPEGWVESGSPAGCWPRRTDPSERANSVDTGFDYREVDFTTEASGAGYRVWFGIVDSEEAVRVVDRISGGDARVVKGRYWAFTRRDPDGQAADISMVAYDGSGAIVADEAAAMRAQDRATSTPTP
jgi:(2Fe-2S) ferredoxin